MHGDFLRWEDPPPRKPPPIDPARLAEKLGERPGEWALVHVAKSGGARHGLQDRLAKRIHAAGLVGRIELRAAGLKLYARLTEEPPRA